MTTSYSLHSLSELSLRGDLLTSDQALAVLRWPDEDVLSLIAAAHRVRSAHFGRKVKINFLVNIQSGLCAEDCGYCSQSKVSKVPVDKYRLMSPDDVEALAAQAVANKASRVCLVASMRGPSERDMKAVEAAVRRVKERYPQLEVCASLGFLEKDHPERLKEAGVDVYNHNLNTSESHYPNICTTHGYEERVNTVQKIKNGGLMSCSGVLIGMGEVDDDIVEVAFALRRMDVHSIPVNFLIPFKGTPISTTDLTPLRCLKILCLFKFLNPKSELRIAGGRELHLRALQPLGLYVANSIFIGDYLTSEGQAPLADLQMIRDMGFEILGEDTPPAPVDVSENVQVLSRRS